MITALTDLSKIPNQSQDQATFDANMAHYLANLPERARQENELAAQLNSIAAGGAYAIPYVIDTSSTTDSDPGTGKLRFDSATQNAATALRADNTSSAGWAAHPLLGSTNDSTSAVKGHFRLASISDPAKFMLFETSGLTGLSGYVNLAVTYAGGNGGSFANGEAVVLYFQRTGDKGDTGPLNSYPALYAQETYSATSAGASYAIGSWATRVLNSMRSNSISGASLASNQVTLPAGIYDFEAFASGYASQYQCRLWNVTDAFAMENGSTEYTTGSITTRSTVSGRFTITSSKVFRLETYFMSGGNGGYNSGNTGAPTVFAGLKFTKVS